MTVRIAHVDDDPDVRETVSRILTKAGYRVDGYAAMSEFLPDVNNPANVPDMVILDVMTETVDAGLTTYRELRVRFPRMPVVFLTSLGNEILPYFSSEAQSSVWIMQKPVEPDQLLSFVRNCLAKSGK